MTRSFVVACAAMAALVSLASGTKELYDGGDLAAAVADEAAYDEIILHKGTYSITETVVVDRKMTIRGADGTTPDEVVLEGDNTCGLVQLNASGSLVAGVTLTKGKVTMSYDSKNPQWAYGAAVWMRGQDSVVSNCIVTANTLSGNATSGIITMAANGTIVTHCVISDNKFSRGGGYTSSIGLAIRTSGSTCHLRNSLIVGNSTTKTDNGSSSVVSTSASGSTLWVVNCTVAGNATQTAGAALKGNIYAVNTIVVGNTKDGLPDVGSAAKGWSYSLTDVSVTGTSCNRADTSVFADYANGDYSLTKNSIVAIDKGNRTRNYGTTKAPVYVDVEATDLAGNDRIMGEEVDIGCYEFDPNERSVVFTVTPDGGTEPIDLTFEATPNGLGEEPTYYWDFDGDGTADIITNKSTFTKNFTSGTYPVKLTAVDATSGGSASYERLAPIIVDRAIASFEMSETSGMEPLPVTLTANCPWIGDHPQYSWDFNGDGVIDLITAEASVRNVFQRGNHPVTLVASNLTYGVGNLVTNMLPVAQGITYKADTDWFFEPFGEPLKVTLTSDLGETPKFYWDVNDDGVAEAITDVPVWRPTLAAGEYHVTVCASNVEAGVGVMIAAEDEMTILSRPRVTVTAADPEVGITAADIQRTIDEAERGSIVTIPKGTHYTGGIPITVLKEIELRGATGKAEDVVLHNDTSTNRIMNIDAGPHCLVHSLSMQKGHGSHTTDSSGAHFCAALLVANRKGFNTLANSGSRASAGLGGCVSNVIVRNSSTDGKYSDCSAVYMRGANAIFTHSVVSNCSAGAAWDAGLFHAVALVVCEGARGENLLIRGNYSTKSGSSDKASVAVQVRGSGSVLRSSTVTDNSCALCGGVNVCSGGRFELCDIAGNTAYYVPDVARRNVWTAFDFSDNGRPTWTSKVPDPSTFTTEAENAAKESIYSVQANNAVDVADCLNETTVYATTAELKPIYRKGAWRLPAGSPAIDVVPAKDVSGMPEKDLNGNRRLVNTLYDLGAFELPNPCGLMLLVK